MADAHRPTAGDFPGSDRVVTVPSTTTIVDAFEILVKNKILAAPVYDEKAHKYTGFFDVMDFLVFVTDVLEKQEAGQVQSPFEFCDLRELLTTVSVINPRALESVCNCSTADPFHPVLPTASLDELLELLGIKGMHRVPVVDPKTNLVTKIISQSAITKFLYKNAEPIKFLKRVTLAEAGIMTQNVVSVREDDPVLLAFQRMRDNKLSGIAVLDEKGKLLSTISSSDLRAVASGKSFQFAGCTVMDFLAKSRALDGPNSRPAVVTVHPDTGMYDIVGKLSATGLHRVFVSSNDHDLLGVISLKDILKFLLLKSKD